MSINELLIKEVRDLPPERAQEVLDFVLFLRQHEERAFLAAASETSLSVLWNTAEEDSAWKNL
jgi:hypothetical protein